MVTSSKLEGLAARFAPYIEELREFFTSRQLLFGSPDLLSPFLDRLDDDPSFAEEMGSMVRSILYREERLPRTELMEMIAVAVGGLHVEDATQDLHEAMRRLLTFVGGVVRSQRAGPPPEIAAEEDFPGHPEPVADLHLRSTPDGSVLALDPVREETNGRLAQTLAASGLSQDPAPAIPIPTVAKLSGYPLSRPEDRIHSRRSLGALLQRSYWIPGVAVLLLVFLVGFYLRQRSGPQPAPIATAPPATIIAALKPSPYTPLAASPSKPAARAHLQSGTPTGTAPGFSSPPTKNSAKLRAFAASANDDRPPAASTAHTARGLNEAPLLLSHSDLSPREGVFLASSGAMASHLLSAPAPGYPKLASFTRVEGQVIIQVVVARDGKVAATRVLDGPRLLRGAAEHAVRRWRYRPYVVDGRPTDVATLVTVSFRLRR